MQQLGESRIEDGFTVTDYSRDGVNVHATVRTPIGTVESEEPIIIPKDPIAEINERLRLVEEMQNEILLGGVLI